MSRGNGDGYSRSTLLLLAMPSISPNIDGGLRVPLMRTADLHPLNTLPLISPGSRLLNVSFMESPSFPSGIEKNNMWLSELDSILLRNEERWSRGLSSFGSFLLFPSSSSSSIRSSRSKEPSMVSWNTPLRCETNSLLSTNLSPLPDRSFSPSDTMMSLILFSRCLILLFRPAWMSASSSPYIERSSFWWDLILSGRLCASSTMRTRSDRSLPRPASTMSVRSEKR